MMQPIYDMIVGNRKYSVYLDSFDDIRDLDFETEEEKNAYLKKFEDDELCSYEVIEYQKCTCCEGWKQIGGIGCMHFASPQEAIEDYIENYSEDSIKEEI